jgi:hypothetical protein
MRPVSVFAKGPGSEIELLCTELQGRWRQAARAVMVLLSLHGLPLSQIAELVMTSAGCGCMTGYAVCATGRVEACRAAAAGGPPGGGPPGGSPAVTRSRRSRTTCGSPKAGAAVAQDLARRRVRGAQIEGPGAAGATEPAAAGPAGAGTEGPAGARVPPERDVNDQLPERRHAARGAGSQGFHARSCCSRSARSAAMARAVWLFTAPRLMPIAAATKASQNREVIAFWDHWKAVSGADPKMLIMDQKVTTQACGVSEFGHRS